MPQFVTQALAGEPITVYGDGSQTRSLCYVDDLIEGLMRLLRSDYTLPVNLGNPHEVTMLQLAEMVRDYLREQLQSSSCARFPWTIRSAAVRT